jgi:tetratricopeptide (TPR) repeat protein
MKSIFISLFVFSLSFSAFSQMKTRDVKSILLQSNLSDAQKMDSVLNFIKNQYQNDPWVTELASNELYTFAVKNGNKEMQAKALFFFAKSQMTLNRLDTDTCFVKAARYFGELNLIDKKIDCLNYLLQYAQTKNDESKFLNYKSELYSSLNKVSQTSKKSREIYYMFHQSMSNLFLSRNELDSAFYHIQMAENRAIELNDDRRLSQCHLNAGNILVYQDEFVLAFEYYLKCKDIAMRLNDKELQSQVAMAMGDAYVYLGEVGASISLFQEANGLALQCKNKGLQLYSMVKQAKGLFYQGKFQSALGLFSGAEILFMSGIGNSLLGEVYLGKGACYNNLIDFEMAEKMFGLAQKEYEKKGIAQHSSLMMNIGVLRLEQKRYQEALEAFKNARNMEIELNSYSNIRTTSSRHMYEIYNLLGDKNRALEMLQNYTIENDTLKNRDAKSKIIALELESIFQYNQIEDSISYAKQLQIQNAETLAKDESLKRKSSELEAKRNQQYLLFGGIGFLAVFILFLYNRFRVTNRQNKIIEAQKDKNLFLSQKILEQDQQLILGETAKTVAHELNSPLGAIKAGAEGLRFLMEELVNQLIPDSSEEELKVASNLSEQQSDAFDGLHTKRQKKESISKSLQEKFGLGDNQSDELATELVQLKVYEPDEQIIQFLISCQDRQPIYKLARCIGQIKMISNTTISATNKSADVVSSVREALNFKGEEALSDAKLKESISSVTTIIESNIKEKGSFENLISDDLELSSVNEFKIFQLWYNLLIFIIEESKSPMRIQVTAMVTEDSIQVVFVLNQAIENKILEEHHYNIIMNAKKDSNDLRVGIVKYLLSDKGLNLEVQKTETTTSFLIDFPVKKA